MGEAYGTDFRIAERMDQEMKAAGFVDVTQKKAKLPLGHWSADPTYREIGTLFEQYYRTGLEGWMMHVMTRSMGVSARETVPSRPNLRLADTPSGPEIKLHRRPKGLSRRLPVESIIIIFICETQAQRVPTSSAITNRSIGLSPQAESLDATSIVSKQADLGPS